MLSHASIKAILVLPFNVLISFPIVLIYTFENFNFCKFISACLAAPLFFLVGISLLSNTIKLFDKVGDGTLAPWSPTKKLVIIGPYKFVRNPMISGVIFILLSEALLFGSLGVLIWALIFFSINTIYFIIKEEPDLQKRFGKEYIDYKNSVPMWIPRLTPYN